MQFLPFRRAESEVPERSFPNRTGGLGQHFGQFRHAGAVAAGIRTLGVNRIGQQSDEGFKQVFLGVQQSLVFDGNRRGARQRGDKRQQFRRNTPVCLLRILDNQQRQCADQFLLTVTQRHDD